MKKIYLAVLLSMLSFSSCSDFLDVNPKAEVVNDDMFNTAQGCEDALWGVYGVLRDNQLYGRQWTWNFFGILSQDLNPADITDDTNIATYNYNDLSSIIAALWTQSYTVIGYLNNIITNIESNAYNFPLESTYLGEAYGLRAMLHFDLVRAFATNVDSKPQNQGIPYVTKYSFQQTPFSTVKEVYEKIEADLKKAQTLLKDDESRITYPRTLDADIKSNFLKGRQLHFNYYAATALLARVLWTSGDYSQARTEALKVINSGKFPLASKDEIPLVVANVVAVKESIWGVYSEEQNDSAAERLNTGASWVGILPYQAALGSDYLNPYDNVYASYLGSQAGIDSRLNWFQPLTQGGTTNYCVKFIDRSKLSSKATLESRGYVGISMMRIPEMYYIVAEAYLRENNSNQAASYINTVLNSRGLTNLESREPALTPSLELLYNERHKEFFSENQRWFDMKKQNEPIISNYAYLTFEASDKYYVLPIPNSEFDHRNE